MNVSGLVSGGVLLFIGLLELLLGQFLGIAQGGFVFIIMGMVFACAGAYMIFNAEKENKIEQIKPIQRVKASNKKRRAH